MANPLVPGIGAHATATEIAKRIEYLKKMEMGGYVSKEVLEQAMKEYINHLQDGIVGGSIGAQRIPNFSRYDDRPPRKRFFKRVTMQGNTGLTEEMAFDLLAGRMRIGDGNRMPFQHISMHITPETAYLFIVSDGGPVIIEDSTNMFPSDNLITQLRLLRG